jgi:hypothetical protein
MIKKASLLFGLIWTGCLYNIPEPQPIPVPKESTRAHVKVRFQQDDVAKEGQLFVCGLKDEEFWCLEYETFNSQLRTY